MYIFLITVLEKFYIPPLQLSLVWTSLNPKCNVIFSFKSLTPLFSCWFPVEAVVVFRRLLWTLNSLVLVAATNPSFREIRIGWASFPWNHSSASAEGSGPMVSGYRSSWNRSDYAGRRRKSALKTCMHTWITLTHKLTFTYKKDI